jgi:hypothetical protein
MSDVMKYLDLSAKKIGLLIGALAIHLITYAQGLELFPLTQSNKAGDKVLASPPKAAILDNSSQSS